MTLFCYNTSNKIERAQRNRRAVNECKNGSTLRVIDDDDEKATAGLAPIRTACASKSDMALSRSIDSRKTQLGTGIRIS